MAGKAPTAIKKEAIFKTVPISAFKINTAGEIAINIANKSAATDLIEKSDLIAAIMF